MIVMVSSSFRFMIMAAVVALSLLTLIDANDRPIPDTVKGIQQAIGEWDGPFNAAELAIWNRTLSFLRNAARRPGSGLHPETVDRVLAGVIQDMTRRGVLPDDYVDPTVITPPGTGPAPGSSSSSS
jgi:hypothetical protein